VLQVLAARLDWVVHELLSSSVCLLFAKERKTSGGSLSQWMSAVVAAEFLVCPGEKDGEV
jgi:hypothetical protein